MESDNWDFIILQGKSTEFTAPSEFMEYGRKFGEILRNKHAHVALYETFANDGKPDDQPKIRHIYDELAKELHAQVVPVGDAFYFVHAQAPSIKLWIEDKLHPTAEGTYLAACLFYTYLTKKNPQGLPSQIKGTDPYSVAPKVAKQLQELAWQFYSR
jgi:hypothetical protein